VNRVHDTAAVGEVYAVGVLRSTWMIPFGLWNVVSCLCQH